MPASDQAERWAPAVPRNLERVVAIARPYGISSLLAVAFHDNSRLPTAADVAREIGVVPKDEREATAVAVVRERINCDYGPTLRGV
jgi:hypothetical protein